VSQAMRGFHSWCQVSRTLSSPVYFCEFRMAGWLLGRKSHPNMLRPSISLRDIILLLRYSEGSTPSTVFITQPWGAIGAAL
jgi:hypothetical protein